MTRRVGMPASIILLAAVATTPAQELVERATFQGHLLPVERTALSSDGKLLASGGGDARGGELILWETATGKKVAALQGNAKSLGGLAFSPDGAMLASADLFSVQLWDVRARRPMTMFTNPDHEWTQTLAFSADGKKLGAASWRHTNVWETATGKKSASFTRRHAHYGCMAFSPDLVTLTLPSYQEIDLWDVSAGKVRATFSEHRGEVNFLRYAADGKSLLAASTRLEGKSRQWKGDLKLWDPVAGKERLTFAGPFGRVSEAALSPDGKILAVLDAPAMRVDPSLKLVNVATGRQTLLRNPPGHLFLAIAFSSGNRLLVVGTLDEKTLRLWEMPLPKKDR